MVRKLDLPEFAAVFLYDALEIMNGRDAQVLDPFRFVLIAVAEWMNQRQLQAIDYVRKENRVLREQLGGDTFSQVRRDSAIEISYRAHRMQAGRRTPRHLRYAKHLKLNGKSPHSEVLSGKPCYRTKCVA